MRKIVAVFVVGCLLGAVATGLIFYRSRERSLASMWFNEELYRTQFSMKQLKLIDEGRIDTLRKVTAMQMESGIDQAYRLMVAEKPGFTGAWPNLREGLQQTELYLAENDGESHLLGWMREVNAYVEDGTR